MRFVAAAMLLLVLGSEPAAQAQAQAPLHIGVLAVRATGREAAQWQPITKQLEARMGMDIQVGFYAPAELEAAVASSALDLVVTNPGQYVLLRERYQLSAPIATQVMQRAKSELSVFGGVIFARADTPGIGDIGGIAGRRIAISDPSWFAGYEIQVFELLERGVAPPRADRLLVTGAPELVVKAVLERRADVGFVRTGLLETMAEDGQLDLQLLTVINPYNYPSFPLLCSTPLYPEWPVAAARSLDPRLARRIAVALLSTQQGSTAPGAVAIRGFTVPADYSGVEDVLRRLRAPPFDARPLFTPSDLWHRYAPAIVATLGALLALLALTMALLRKNQLLRQAERRMGAILDSALDAVVQVNARGVITGWNSMAQTIFGWSREQALGSAIAQTIIPEQHRQAHAIGMQRHLLTGQTKMLNAIVEIDAQHRDGRQFPVELIVTAFAGGSGTEFNAFIRDITQRNRDKARTQLAASVFLHAREGITITDAEGTIVDVNESFSRITGYTREEAIGANPRILHSGRQGPEFYAAMWQSIQAKGHWRGEIWNRCKNGEVIAELLTISAVRDEAGRCSHYVALFTDITEMKQHQQQLEQTAHYDALTKLPNRILLADRLRHAMALGQRRVQSLAVACLDLDGFKAINDLYGHMVGDELLVTVSGRLKAALREGDTLARVGGDEFVAVMVDLKQLGDYEQVLARLLRAAAEPVHIGPAHMQVSATIGVTLYPQDGADADQLLRHADHAMYQAKRAGKNRYQMFDRDHEVELKSRMDRLQRMREALVQREFVLHYQPKVNMRTGRVIGAEALIRWQHPEHGLLSPGAFLPLIEDHPLSVELGEWVIDTALKQIRTWQSQDLEVIASVNIGARQLQHESFTSQLARALGTYPDVAPKCLELEILETSSLADIAQVSAVMQACRALGVSFALDDFGTGYASLTYLRHFPAEVLKIDQSFVRQMLDDADDLAIVKGVVGLAQAFERRVIAEGVETTAHGQVLLALGCECAQGFSIARPMPAAEFPDWLRSWRPDPSWVQ